MRIPAFLAALLLAVGVIFVPSASHADIQASISFDFFAPPPVAIAPPALPVYVVPPPPMEGYIWTPGHWRWGEYGYFWVPGTWVQPPAIGLLWTPGYWGWQEGAFVWHEGYWGPHVGFYGGINYGGGYGGSGFFGGQWHGGVYNVNRSVMNVTNITNVTNNNTTIINHTSNASFNGGPGGTPALPTPAERAFANERHIAPTQEQVAHAQAASRNPDLMASANHGRPVIAATARPGDFKHNVFAARQAGARNMTAEQHNNVIRQNPSFAKGAAMPRNGNMEQPAHKPEGNWNEQRNADQNKPHEEGAGEQHRAPDEDHTPGEGDRHPPE